MENNKIIVFDGHDGAGKTTVALEIEKKFSLKYVKPFNDSLGKLIAWSYRKKQYEFTHLIARLAIEKVIDENPNMPLLFDRHWLCLFTVLPESYFEKWYPLPFTILFWTDWQTTIKRLKYKGEVQPPAEIHQHYCLLYKKIAEKYKIPLIDTTNISQLQTIEEVSVLIKQYLND